MVLRSVQKFLLAFAHVIVLPGLFSKIFTSSMVSMVAAGVITLVEDPEGTRTCTSVPT